MVLDSEEANLMKESLNNCETPPLEGEKKFCTESLESMVDNVISILGTHHLQAISTMINGSQHEKTVYKVASPLKKFLNQDKIVICHPEPFPQAVHYCHKSSEYEVYAVVLVGDNRSIVNAIVVCHHLKMVPKNNDPICHFLPEDHLIWVHSI
ncbi:hypothetical protein LUZ61_005776 [Rhynchospora tenuis]|uniref:BURP domain-containing protein n=1 Tax=Rhynchospora tenuis TaxID=198213 RepID=A0AAD6EUW5_9POAL|nr:hypothetical protein LUZ61_005776 [Rhynchospora tenuis]